MQSKGKFRLASVMPSQLPTPMPSLSARKGISTVMESSAAAGVSSLESDGKSISEHATAFAEFAVNESRDVLSFYELEEQILALYDHLNDLKLEIGLLGARDTLPSSMWQETPSGG